MTPALNTPCRSAERAALDKAVKALQEIAEAIELQALLGMIGEATQLCAKTSRDTLAQIAKLVPDVVTR